MKKESNTYKLRPYQEDGVRAALEFFENGNDLERPICVMPTGAGKSIVIAHITNELQGGVLILQPSKELLEQNYAKFKTYGGHACIYSASLKSKEIGRITFATIGSIKNKAEEFSHVKYIIIDECHLVPPNISSMFVSFLTQLFNVKIIGLTATPFRLKTYRDPWSGMPFSQINLLTRERPRFFTSFLHITQISELYEQKFLSPIKYIGLAWDAGKLRVNTTGAEYTEESIKQAIDSQEIVKKLPTIVKQSIEKGRKFRIVFVYSVMDAQILALRTPDSAYVSADTPKKEREEILNNFKAGIIKTIYNVGILTIGFDFPELDTIIIARPTMSLALYMQMIGRGIRLHPKKENCVVLDMCGNIERFSTFENIKYVKDYKGQWIIHDGIKQLSGVKLG
jgi:DNA repair protein RadD